MPPHVHAQVNLWTASLPVSLVLFLAAVGYGSGWWHLSRVLPQEAPLRQPISFMCGLLIVWVTVASALAPLDHFLLVFHMVKHLLLMLVAAPLILWAKSGAILVSALSPGLNLNEVFHRRSFRWLTNFITHPVSCWLAAMTTIIGWHLPFIFQIAMRSRAVHLLEELSFLVAGLLFWFPVMRVRSPVSDEWLAPLYLFLATLPCDILSAFLVFGGRVVYRSYMSAPGLLGFSPLEDQEFAGALMWIVVTFAYLIPAGIITMRILSPRAIRSANSWIPSNADTLTSPGIASGAERF